MDTTMKIFLPVIVTILWTRTSEVRGQCAVGATLKIALVSDAFLNDRVRRQFNLVNGRGSMDMPSQEPGQCFRVETRLVDLGQRLRGLSDVFDTQVATILNNSDLIVGAFDYSMYNFARKNSLYYLTTTPLPLAVETDNARKSPNTKFLSIWPAMSLYVKGTVEILDHMLYMNDNNKILFLHYSETEASIEFVDAIIYRTKTIPCILTSYDLKREVDKFRGKTILEIRQNDGFFAYFKHLRKLLTMTKFRYVVLHLDLPTKVKIKMVDWFFQDESELEDKGTDWLMADMTFPLEQYALAELRRYAITRPRFFYLAWDPFDSLTTCAAQQEYGDLENVALIRLYDILVKAAEERMTSQDGEWGLRYFVPTFNRHWRTSELELQMRSQTYGKLNFPKYPLFVMYERTPEREEPACGHVRIIFTGQDKMMELMQKNGEILKNMVWRGDYRTEYGLGGIPIVNEIHYAVVIQDAPFVTKPSEHSNDYEGMAMDIFHAVRRILIMEGLDLKLQLKEAETYGSKENGTWNGVLGMMQNDKNVVLGIGQLTVTEERAEDFDFTIPIGYSFETFLVRKQVLHHQYFQFLRPFTSGVWLVLALVMIISGLYLFCIDQWNPFKDDIPEENKFNGEEGLWHSFLVITQAGAPFGAHTYPNRVYSIFYWFFALVVVGCYTGNLANFLIESAISVPNIDIYSLARNDYYSFGMMKDTSVSTSFKNDPKLYSLWEKVNERNDFVKNYSAGLEEVRDRNFVLFGTSLVLTYRHNHDDNCMMYIYQPTFYNRRRSQPIAFPMRRDWVYKERFKRALERLKETGEMQIIYKRWMDFSASCQAGEEDEGHLRLGWFNFIGLYVLLAVGILLAYTVLLFKLRHLKLKGKGPSETEDEAKTPADDVEQNPEEVELNSL